MRARSIVCRLGLDIVPAAVFKKGTASDFEERPLTSRIQRAEIGWLSPFSNATLECLYGKRR
jgi:hypothetical protein